MSADPPAAEAERSRYWITDVEVSPGNTDPNCKFSARIFLDDELVCNLPSIDHTRPLRWSGLLLCNVSQLSKIALRLCKSVKGKPRYFNFLPLIISEVDEETGESTLELPEAAWVITIKSLSLTLAEKLFPDGVERFRNSEGSYERSDPDGTQKYLFKNALQFASIIAEAVPESTTKVSFLVYMKAWEALEEQTELDDTIQGILSGLVRIGEIVDIMGQASSLMLATALDQSKESINGILELLEDASVSIYNQCTTNDLAHVPHDETGPDDAYDVEAYLSLLENLQKDFYASWSTATSCPDPEPTYPVDNEPSGTQQQDVHAVADESTTRIDPYETLNQLRPMDPNGYDPDQACLEGTREAVLNKILTWTQNRDNSESFLWISGQIGMGKTAIAASLCQRLDDIGALAGSFFCQHDDPESSDPLRLINNLIHDFAMQCPAYAHEVARAIRGNRRACNAHLGLRYEHLVKRPLQKLKSLSTPRTVIAIVDGLDECGDYESREKILQKLYDMSRLVPWLKVIVTARPVGDIQHYFRNQYPSAPIIQLQDYDASHDIRPYIQHQLGQISRAEHWPDDSIDKLCTMSQGVFVWAKLAIKYIKSSTLPSMPRLKTVLDNRKSPVTDQLDAIYTSALKTTIGDGGDEVKNAYLRCIGAILATSERQSLAIPDLQYLLLVADQVDQPTLEQILKNLGPLLLGIVGGHAKFVHSSFKDYATHSSRSGEFFVSPDRYEANPAICCLQVMQRDLRFNICGLETSHLLNSQVPDLKRRVATHIGPTLKYACIHWIDHSIVSPNQILVETIKSLFEGPQLMYWIEALSLLDRLDAALTGLSTLASLELNQFPLWDAIVSSAKDAHRFLLSFYGTISASTPHLYISALAFSPNTSITAQRMRSYFPNTITLPKDDISTWHPCVKSILHPHPVQSLSISPDGSSLATGYPDGSISVWDVRTDTHVHKPLVGHSTSVTCIAFSSDSRLLASSSYDTTIRVWGLSGDMDTRHVLSGHSASTHAVAFAPNSTLLASGSSDKTIRLWDTTMTRPASHPYTGHSNRISAVVFSPDGMKLASGSWDQTIRLWSLDSGGSQLTMNPLLITGHSDLVTCISFSPDGTKIASGSADKTVRTWGVHNHSDVESQQSLGKHADGVTSVGFSPDGKLVISGSSDGVIQLWDIVASNTRSRSFGHSNSINGVIFSPDGAYAVSGSTDRTTRMWEIGATPTLGGSARPQVLTLAQQITHSSAILAVAISRDGSRIASGSEDHMIRMWDAQTGASIGGPFTGHSHNVWDVSFSPDGTRIISTCYDEGHVMCWDTSTHTMVNSHNDGQVKPCSAFSPNGTFVAFTSRGHDVHLWDFAGWKMVGNALRGHSQWVWPLAFSPDEAYLASAAADGIIILWDIKTHSQLRGPLSGHTARVKSLAFSPCGTLLVSGSDDKTLRIWDTETGNTMHTLNGHSAPVRSVTFSPNGSCIASGSEDKTVRLWDSKTGEPVGEPFAGHSDQVTCIAFSPDGGYVISGSRDCTIRAWRMSTPLARPVAQPTTESVVPFSWASSPYEFSSHPDHPEWVTDNQKSLMFWLPAHYERPDQFLRTPTRVPNVEASLDYSKFVHGTAWTGVACDSIRNSSG